MARPNHYKAEAAKQEKLMRWRMSSIPQATIAEWLGITPQAVSKRKQGGYHLSYAEYIIINMHLNEIEGAEEL